MRAAAEEVRAKGRCTYSPGRGGVRTGFLPFSAIYIELHYIFASVWGQKWYTLYGVLFVAFLMLVIVTSFITIALTYFQLAIEDHRWWWRSFSSGGAVAGPREEAPPPGHRRHRPSLGWGALRACAGSTGLFVFAYSIFYYFERSNMFGFMQTSFFFGYMAMMSFAAFAMLGMIGFFSGLVFVRRIYRELKFD